MSIKMSLYDFNNVGSLLMATMDGQGGTVAMLDGDVVSIVERVKEEDIILRIRFIDW